MISMFDLPAPPPRHPAKFSAELHPTFSSLLARLKPKRLLDPFAGTGGIFKLQPYSLNTKIYAVELEPEWAAADPRIEIGDALDLDFPDDFFDAILTSPTYGSRLAHHHEAKDGSQRHTYRHYLGRPLHPDNSGQLQWGESYREFHRKAWTEARRVLCHGGVFILNVKDHVRRGLIMRVADWHVECLMSLGFVPEERIRGQTPGNRHGQNGNLRVPYEEIVLFRLSKSASEPES